MDVDGNREVCMDPRKRGVRRRTAEVPFVSLPNGSSLLLLAAYGSAPRMIGGEKGQKRDGKSCAIEGQSDAATIQPIRWQAHIRFGQLRERTDGRVEQRIVRLCALSAEHVCGFTKSSCEELNDR